jgi:hypothetical protein
VHPSDKTRDPDKREEPKDLREANENIRRSQGDDAMGPTESRKAGNKPAFDRDR